MRPTCSAAALLLLSSPLAFSQSGASTGRYNADRRADFLHLRLELRFTPDGIRARPVSGAVEYELKPSAGELAEVDLDAARMKITAVRLSGAGYGQSAPARFFYDDERLRVFLPAPLQAVSIGELVATTPSAGFTTYHWRSQQPADAHLIGLAIGAFVRVEDRWRGMPVAAYVPCEKEAAARYSFRRVPEMLEFYSRFTGVDYPYPAFTHAAVPDHFHRGMEHAGLSMLDPICTFSGPARPTPRTFSFTSCGRAPAWWHPPTPRSAANRWFPKP